MNLFDPLEIPITACIHLILTDPATQLPVSLGSGVFIKYKDRFFICTAEHVAFYKNCAVSIITGQVKDGQSILYEYGSFSYMQKFSLTEPTAENLIKQLDSLENGENLDVAFRETTLMDNVIQPARKFNIEGLREIDIKCDGKSIILADNDFPLDENELFCFFGRTNGNIKENILDFKERLYWGLTFHGIDNEYIAFDLGSPIGDHARFEGCSGAPIFDTKGRLVALLTHGDEDVNSSIIYGFRFDKTKDYIDLMYFNENLNK